MGLRFRRNGSLSGLLGSEAKKIDKVLRRAANGSVSEESFELEPLVEQLFEREPTPDIEALKARDVDAATFFNEELRPNWDGLGRGERSAKISAFMRLANTVGTDDPAGLGAVVRTKVLVLAWAYDHLYGQDLTRQLARTPQSFGTLQHV